VPIVIILFLAVILYIKTDFPRFFEVRLAETPAQFVSPKRAAPETATVTTVTTPNTHATIWTFRALLFGKLVVCPPQRPTA
jgi:hypothetical protein